MEFLRHKKNFFIILISASLLLLIAIIIAIVKTSTTSNYDESKIYSDTLFDTSYIHKINVEIPESSWEDLLSNPTQKTKYQSNVTIDGFQINDVSFATKGTTSLTQVASSDSNRYSFKINFGKYIKNQTYYGLDKLNLNNSMFDTTYLKDYLSYFIMRDMNVEAPLTSYVELSINGEPYGLYIAIEEIEDSFLARNNNAKDSVLYKPEKPEQPEQPEQPEPERPTTPLQQNPTPPPTEPIKPTEPTEPEDLIPNAGADLVYIDDNVSSYSDIFDHVANSSTPQDEANLIQALQALTTKENIEKYWDIAAIINYFAVHNFLLNFDSYTGESIHNYYLLQENHLTTILPWDYNLAFGTLVNDADDKDKTYLTKLINWGIDSPLSNSDLYRPLWQIIIDSPIYLQEYHDKLSELVSRANLYTTEISKISSLIHDSVANDPTAFSNLQQFNLGVQALQDFITLRTQSVAKQLSGDIPATNTAQASDPSNLIDGTNVNIEDMGTNLSNQQTPNLTTNKP